MRKQETNNVITELETYLDSFSEFEKGAAGHNLPWLRSLRRDAFARFCEVGFPTTHDEDWRFTNVSAIAQTPFRLARNRPTPLSRQQLEPCQLSGITSPLLFLNGRLSCELSSLGQTPGGGE